MNRNFNTVLDIRTKKKKKGKKKKNYINSIIVS